MLVKAREGTIRKVWDNREAILERSALLYEEVKERTFRASVGRFTKLEDMLYIWIDSMRRAKLPIPSSLAIAKTKSIASSLSILESESFQSKIQTASKPNTKNFKTYTKWQFMTCSTNKSWTLIFLPKNVYLTGMRT